jgi:hypothetical protein
MSLADQLELFGSLMPLEKLRPLTKRPVALLSEEVEAVVPSIEMRQDGPLLSNLYLVTAHFLCEVRVDVPGENFDFVSLQSISHYRVELWEHQTKDADGNTTRFELARIELMHGSVGEPFRSELSYAGTERDAWLKLVTEAIPVQLVL